MQKFLINQKKSFIAFQERFDKEKNHKIILKYTFSNAQ
jgi:hypothetical protein